MSNKEHDYLNKTIDRLVEKTEKILDTVNSVDKRVDELDKKVAVQNGRVTESEKQIRLMNKKWEKILFAVLGFLSITVVSMGVYIFQSKTSDSKIEELIRSLKEAPINVSIDSSAIQDAIEGVAVDVYEVIE